jgi:hypothetical protein
MVRAQQALTRGSLIIIKLDLIYWKLDFVVFLDCVLQV